MVDYFGRIVSLTNDAPWMKLNAMRDLMETEHPRAFFYLIADFYKNYSGGGFGFSSQSFAVKNYKAIYEMRRREVGAKILNILLNC